MRGSREDQLVARPSRCLTEDNAPQSLHWAEVGGDRFVVSTELTDAIRSSVADSMVIEAVQDFRALLERIEQCRAIDPDDVVPVARHPQLWELRVNDQSSGVHIRIYCAELPELPHIVVALHAHAKFVAGTPADIKARQDEAISLAILRLEAGRRTWWGLPRSDTPA